MAGVRGVINIALSTSDSRVIDSVNSVELLRKVRQYRAKSNETLRSKGVETKDCRSDSTIERGATL